MKITTFTPLVVTNSIDKNIRLFEKLGFEAELTNKGGVLVFFGGEKRDDGLLLEAHLDTLGGMVAEIKSNGRLKLTNLGGKSYGIVVEGQYHTAFALSNNELSETTLDGLSVAPRANHKLAFKFYGPFEVVERVGAVAYRLALPPTSRVHPVFHVSLLRKVLASDCQVLPLLPDPDDQF